MSGPRTILYLQPTSELGGSDIALLRVIRGLDPTRWRAVVVLPADGPLAAAYREAGALVRLVPMPGLPGGLALRRQARYLAAFPGAAVGVARIARREHAALIHTNSLFAPHGAVAALLARVPHVVHVREIPDAPAPVRVGLMVFAAVLSRRVVAISEAVAARTVGRAWRRRTVVLIDGIDTDAFRPDPAARQSMRAALGIPPDVLLVGMAARLDPWKGAEVFVRAAARIAALRSDTWFVLAGPELPAHAAYAATIRSLIAELGLTNRLVLTGDSLGPDQMPGLMTALDVLLHPPVRPEPFGLVVVEAMASGVPVVASGDGGPAEIVADGETGLLFTPGDDAAAAAAVLALLGDGERRRSMGQAGRERAIERFTSTQRVPELAAVYEDVLGVAA